MMLSSDVFLPQAANTVQSCSVFVFLDIGLFFRFLRNILDKRGQRSGRCARRWHSHHQRWRQPCTRRRKERILHLDCRGSCVSGLYLFSLSPLFLLHLWPLPPSWQWGTSRLSTHREVPQVFSCYCLCWAHFCHTHLDLYVFFVSLWQPVFTGSLPLLPKWSPFSHFSSSLIPWKSVYLPWLLLTWPFAHVLCRFLPIRHPNTCCVPFVQTHPQTHIITHINTVPKNTDATELLSMPSCIVCQ